jgi:hypothetical protein
MNVERMNEPCRADSPAWLLKIFESFWAILDEPIKNNFWIIVGNFGLTKI